MIEIEKGIEMPNTKGRKRKYPFGDMEVGDSFKYPDGKAKNSIVGGANAWAKRLGNNYRFAVRTIDGKFRLWRIK